jgi:hypothetical protein
MGQIYKSDSIALSGAGGEKGTVTSVDGIPPDSNGNIPLDAYTPDNPPPGTVFEAGEVTSLPAGSEPTVSFNAEADGSQSVNFGIPVGEQGAEGEAGPANTLTIGTVITGEPDDPAAAEITGDAPDQILNLTIPKGKPGESAAGFPENYNTIEILDSTAISLAPEFSGELSKTYHISQSVEVDLASFGSTASGGNPNAVLRLIIHGHTPDPVITFKNGGYYYTPEGKHVSVAPVVDTSLAPTNQELAVIELRYIPTTNAQGYAISVMQAFPNGVTGAWIT